MCVNEIEIFIDYQKLTISVCADSLTHPFSMYSIWKFIQEVVKTNVFLFEKKRQIIKWRDFILILETSENLAGNEIF